LLISKTWTVAASSFSMMRRSSEYPRDTLKSFNVTCSVSTFTDRSNARVFAIIDLAAMVVMSALRTNDALLIDICKARYKLVGATRIAFDEQRFEFRAAELAGNMMHFTLGKDFPSICHRDAASWANKTQVFGFVHGGERRK